jgi:hypothetical protein
VALKFHTEIHSANRSANDRESGNGKSLRTIKKIQQKAKPTLISKKVFLTDNVGLMPANMEMARLPGHPTQGDAASTTRQHTSPSLRNLYAREKASEKQKQKACYRIS